MTCLLMSVMLQDVMCKAARNTITSTNWLASQQNGLLCLGVAMVQLFKLQTCNKEGHDSSQTLTAIVEYLHDSMSSTVR